MRGYLLWRNAGIIRQAKAARDRGRTVAPPNGQAGALRPVGARRCMEVCVLACALGSWAAARVLSSRVHLARRECGVWSVACGAGRVACGRVWCEVCGVRWRDEWV